MKQGRQAYFKRPILIGGVLDGNAMVKLAMWLQGKELYTGTGFLSEIKPEYVTLARQRLAEIPQDPVNPVNELLAQPTLFG